MLRIKKDKIYTILKQIRPHRPRRRQHLMGRARIFTDSILCIAYTTKPARPYMATAKSKRTPTKAKAKPAKAASQPGTQNGSPMQIEEEVVQFRHYLDGYTHKDLGLSADQVVGMYRNMMLQRRFEERAAQMYGRQKIAGFLHLYIGQEAVSTGAAYAAGKEDYVITAYRDHGIGLALGMDTNACMAELFGKIDGCSRGKGGSMHYFDKELNFLGGHGIVGGQIPVGVGVAFGCKYKKTGGVCLTYFGDGAIQQGAFHEAANLAGLYNLPVVLICENNMYGMGTAVDRSSAETDLYKRAVSYGIHGAVADGMDVFTMYKAHKDLMDLARKGEPSLLEIRTYRYRGHSMSDPGKYRTKEELAERKNDDPILRLKAYIMEHELAKVEDLDQIDEEVKAEVLASVEFAENSPLPPLESIYEDVYVQEDYPFDKG